MDAPFPFAKSSSYPVRSTASLEYLIDGRETFTAIAGAIEKATRSVYITVAYASLNFRMLPPAEEQFLDLLRRTAARGVQVAVLFWLPSTNVSDTIPPSQAGLLKEAKVLARWDKAKATGIYESFPIGCHHQKTFVVDGSVAFVGGLNMTQPHWDEPTHLPDDERRITYDVVDPAKRATLAASPNALPLHDTFVGIEGPAVQDVQANFLQRWNGATERGAAPDLPMSPPPSADGGSIPIQIVRTIPEESYSGTPKGERSVKEAMLNIIDGARQAIYFENQYFFDDDVTAAIRRAAERGVRVVGLLTRRPDAGQPLGVIEKFLEDKEASTFQWAFFNEALQRHIQLYTPFTDHAPVKDIYIHSKTMIVDDRYVLLGSANISFTSLDFHSEMCALADDPRGAQALRRRLWCEHLCCTDASLPVSFAEGADRWQNDGRRNQQDIDLGHPPRSRVAPLRPPSIADIPVLRAASGFA
ncbi:MAG TPA: phosphatidylserine/phosphatidylglycerophosphate/cardiolipin synthase family protein [Anaeromyxobacteraceae bacterium]|nr:phosphatidylserine/phosphatidylglycerophosphate/cardiolipin synthase family protein [Anaeromyxobacteraceae bacterium]